MPLLAELVGIRGVIVAINMAILADLGPIAAVTCRKPASRQEGADTTGCLLVKFFNFGLAPWLLPENCDSAVRPQAAGEFPLAWRLPGNRALFEIVVADGSAERW